MTTQKKWLTTSEAVKYTNKGLSTIRRLIAQMTTQEKSQHLKEETFRGKKRYLLSRQFLSTKYNIGTNTSKPSEDLLRTLENQLEKKDQQINRLQTSLEDLTERHRETNILLQTEQKRSIALQDQLNQLTAPKEEPAPVDTKEPDTTEEEAEQETKKELPTKEVPRNVGLFGKDISNTSALILMVITISILMVIGIVVLQG